MAARDRETVAVGPFTAFIDPLRTHSYLSFAVPAPGTGRQQAAAAVPALEAAFRSRDRFPRAEYIEDLCPELAGVLEAGGWRVMERIPVMTCRPGGLLRPSPPGGIAVEVVGPGVPADRTREFMAAQRAAFSDPEAITDEQVQRNRERAHDSIHVAAVSDGAIVGTAVGVPIVEGVVEIVGVATLAEHRGRGIAGALTAEVAARAFAAGAQLAWLSAADEAAARIYAGAGFAVAGTQVGLNAD